MHTRNHITLSELACRIKSVLSDAFAYQHYWVVADVTDHKFYAGRNAHYFCLAEKSPATHILTAKMSAVAWGNSGAAAIASFQQATGQVFKSGIRVLVNVSVSFHQQYGLQLVLNDIDASYTIGQLEQQRLEVLERLLKEWPQHVSRAGDRYITTNNKIRLGSVVQKIAVVTSSSAAGYFDFKTTLDANRHGYHVHLTPYFTTVQGEANAEGLCRRMAEIKDSGTPYDAVVIIRGGGAQTDLLLFNHYYVARMVASFPIPVISGIGHQINETITDLMAHTSAKTPSIAAETIIAHNRAFEEGLMNMQQTIIIRSQQMVSARQQQLSGLNSLLISSSREGIQTHKDALYGLGSKLATRPLIEIGKRQGGLDSLADALGPATARYLNGAHNRLEHYRAVVKLMSPESILKRGFAMVAGRGGIIADPAQLREGDKITIHMDGAAIGATIDTITKEPDQQ